MIRSAEETDEVELMKWGLYWASTNLVKFAKHLLKKKPHYRISSVVLELKRADKWTDGRMDVAYFIVIPLVHLIEKAHS